MATYNGTDIKDLDVSTPDGTAEPPSVLDNSDREIKIVLKNQFARVAKTADYTATTSDSIIEVDATSGAVTITLPAVADVSSATFTKRYIIKKIDSSANTVTVDGNASETIDGATTFVISAQYEGVTVEGNGTAWFTFKPRPADDTITTAMIQDDAITTAKVLDENITAAKLDLSGTEGTQNVSAGGTYTIPEGLYIFYTLTAGQLNLQANLQSSWRNIQKWFGGDGGSNGDVQGGYVWSDGTNMRLSNPGGSTVTVYYIKRD